MPKNSSSKEFTLSSNKRLNSKNIPSPFTIEAGNQFNFLLLRLTCSLPGSTGKTLEKPTKALVSLICSTLTILLKKKRSNDKKTTTSTNVPKK